LNEVGCMERMYYTLKLLSLFCVGEVSGFRLYVIGRIEKMKERREVVLFAGFFCVSALRGFKNVRGGEGD
jgi:hypothetical protein